MACWRFLSKWGPRSGSACLYMLLILRVLTGTKPSPPERPDWTNEPSMQWIRENFWWILLVLVMFMAVQLPVSAVAKWRLRKAYGGGAIRGVLNAFQKRLSKRMEFPHTFRITLFRAHKCRWLKKYARSGYVTIQSRTKFRINRNKEHKNEGIAGRTWYTNTVIIRNQLPDVSGAVVAEQDIIDYAAATFYDPKKVRKRCPRSRSLAGFPVLVHGEPWGVLVFDAESSEAIEDSFGKKSLVRYLLGTISLALEACRDETMA